MNRRAHLACTHAGLLFAALLICGVFIVAGWIPPPSPERTAADVARGFAADRLHIGIGMTLLALGSAFYWPFSAAIASQLRRIEGARPVLAVTELAAATGTVLAVLLPAYVWLALTFRPGATAPDTVRLFDDFAWLTFIGMYPPALVQNLAIGACILGAAQPATTAARVYPRWLGWLNYAVALAYAVGAPIPFFKRGPFAWDGLIGFWLAAVCFFGWVGLMWWATARAIRREAAGS